MTIPMTSRPMQPPSATPPDGQDATDSQDTVAAITVTVTLNAAPGASRGDVAHARSVYASALARLRGVFDEADAAVAHRGDDVRLTLTVQHATGK
ncbi:hypothetical protein [Actinomadura sp. 3N407]|uniref:hypothetical protein n=1 Tax=Actinomadura sp. 3N407 TaxID=3457423 RepID=UPI003FCC9B71